MDSSLSITLEDGLLKIRRNNSNGQSLRDYYIFPLSQYKQGKRQVLNFAINDEENRKLFLSRELAKEEAEAIEQERYALRYQNQCEKAQLIKELFDDDVSALIEPSVETDTQYDEIEWQPIYIAVFSHHNKLYCRCGKLDSVYHSLVRLRMEVKQLHLSKESLEFELYANAENIYGLQIGNTYLQVGEAVSQPVKVLEQNVAVSTAQLKSKPYELTVSIPSSELADVSLGENSPVKMEGNTCYLTIEVDGVPVKYRITKKIPLQSKLGFRHSKRENYIPVASIYYDDYALQIRRNNHSNFLLFKRQIYPAERMPFFRFMDSKPVSFLFYQLGRILSHMPWHKKVALFNEKYSEKAEEGVFELFQFCVKSKKTHCYFIIDRHCSDYERVKASKNVVTKYSLKYYWLFYNVNYFISTEAPLHLNVFNSNNRYIRMTAIRHPFIFLQHGITYLKRHGERSTYVRGKPGQASYVVVGSEKERKVVSEMFGLSTERIWNTGLLIFDHCKYKHITQESEDLITIMLTWKPYEEHLDSFEDSTYFQYTIKTYKLLQKYVDPSKISIVVHPRAYDLFKSTSLHDLIWDRPISEVLKQSKLLITDYSSVCWNSFYQGGGVIFLQPDLETYENYVGRLIPEDYEYIGHRVFDFDNLDHILAEGLKEHTINLSYFRTPEHEAMYEMINEFHDGRNTERLYQTLKKKGFL